jgi:NAD(P)-dependent dehydrogenase (short-subunit alcohol dehydrogenase family)
MASRLSGKVAIVTGGGTGYGLGIATKLKNEGAEVIIADISEANGTTAAKELNGSFVKADVTSRSDWQNLLDSAINKYGKVDIVVNNAGVCYDKKPSETVSDREFDLTMNVNVKSIFHSVAVVVPYFLSKDQDGVFISIASTSAIRPRPELSWYAASKAAVNIASNALAIEYASRKIRFNTVCPVVGLTSM